MKGLIYQYWRGALPGYAQLSQRLFRDYAEAHGLDYRFDDNPDFFTGKYAEYYHVLRPLYDPWFHQFDRVLYLDMDVFPTQTASGAIFAEEIGHLAMAEERDQPLLRQSVTGPINARNDARWAGLLSRLYGVQVPRTDMGAPRVFNSGVVLYSGDGMRACPPLFPNRRLYGLMIRLAGLPRFYRLDQNYLGLAAFRPGVQFTELPDIWNAQVRSATGGGYEHVAPTGPAQFVHLQTRDRGDLSDAEILEIVNRA